MRRLFLIFHLIILFNICLAQSFIENQLSFDRVRSAQQYDDELKILCEEKGLIYPPKKLYIRVFKFDKLLEVWGSNGGKYVKIKDFEICTISGHLGPKRSQGDKQIPEGFYHLTQFNPSSQYFLSLKINYPNESDRKLGNPARLGGDIYIHGDCVTVGCIPIENEGIKELYWLAAQVKQHSGGEIPIHIFPFLMDELSVLYFKKLNLFSQAHWQFWSQLLPAFNYFEKYHLLPQYKISEDGSYAVKE